MNDEQSETQSGSMTGWLIAAVIVTALVVLGFFYHPTPQPESLQPVDMTNDHSADPIPLPHDVKG